MEEREKRSGREGRQKRGWRDGRKEAWKPHICTVPALYKSLMDDLPKKKCFMFIVSNPL